MGTKPVRDTEQSPHGSKARTRYRNRVRMGAVPMRPLRQETENKKQMQGIEDRKGLRTEAREVLEPQRN